MKKFEPMCNTTIRKVFHSGWIHGLVSLQVLFSFSNSISNSKVFCPTGPQNTYWLTSRWETITTEKPTGSYNYSPKSYDSASLWHGCRFCLPTIQMNQIILHFLCREDTLIFLRACSSVHYKTFNKIMYWTATL